MKTLKRFTTVRKPIYIAEVVASSRDFPFTCDIFNKFIERNPQYADCQYDRFCKGDEWTLKLYRECAIDFVE